MAGAERVLEKAANHQEMTACGRNRQLLELAGQLKRITLHVSADEYNRLLLFVGDDTPQTLLESFVADLTESERSVWKQCRDEAQSWRIVHERAEDVTRAYLSSLDELR